MGIWNKIKNSYNCWRIQRDIEKAEDENNSFAYDRNKPAVITSNNNHRVTNEWKNGFSRGWDKQDGSPERKLWQ